VRKTGRAVVHEAPTFVGLGAEVAAALAEACFDLLEAIAQYPLASFDHRLVDGELVSKPSPTSAARETQPCILVVSGHKAIRPA
jgi:hypothetical protein